MDTLEKLENWYLSQCNGEWEHYSGFSIQTLDNPGWAVTIDLKDTDFESDESWKIERHETEFDWIVCQLVDNSFQGNGGPRNLREILDIFFDWSERVTKSDAD